MFLIPNKFYTIFHCSVKIFGPYLRDKYIYQTFLIGCKIKALRAKTNTYIKTPVRGEEPVFVVTGRKEDVALAKAEILSAADHFSQVPYFIPINQKYIDRLFYSWCS